MRAISSWIILSVLFMAAGARAEEEKSATTQEEEFILKEEFDGDYTLTSAGLYEGEDLEKEPTGLDYHGWRVTDKGKVRIKDGKMWLKQGPETEISVWAAVMAGDSSWSDYEVVAKVLNDGGPDDATPLKFRMQGRNKSYILTVYGSGKCYIGWIDQDKIPTGDVTLVAGKLGKGFGKDPVTLKVEVKGSIIKAYVNDELIAGSNTDSIDNWAKFPDNGEVQMGSLASGVASPVWPGGGIGFFNRLDDCIESVFVKKLK